MPGGLSQGGFALLWFCYFFAIGGFNPYAPLWFKDLGFSTLAIGSLASLQAWSRVVTPYAWGWLGDHTGRRMRIMQIGVALSLLAAAGLLWTRGYAAVAVCTTMLFLANSAVVPLTEAAFARRITTADGIDNARYGRVRVWGSCGFIASVLLFGALLQWGGIGLFPWLVVATWALLLLAALRMPDQRDDVSGHDAAPAILSVMRRPAVAWFYASVFFTVLAHTGLYTFFSLYLDALGHGKQTVGMLWAVSVVVEIGFFWWQGRFFDRLTPHRWLQWAAGLSALRFAGVALLGNHVLALVLLQLLHAVTFAGQHAACIALIARHFPGALRGRAQALYSMLGYGVSGVVGGVAGGWLSSTWGYPSVFWASAGAALVAWLCASWSARRDAAAA